MGNFSDRHHCQKVCVYGGTDGRRRGSSLLPWGHGIWKAHRRLHSSTASPAAMTPTKPLPRVFCVRKPWYTESDNSEFSEFIEVYSMRTMISIILMVIAALVGFFFGAGMNEAMGGAILLSMITGFACTISAIEKNKKE